MAEVERKEFWEGVRRERLATKNYVAEQFLKELGYGIEYESGVREQPAEVTDARKMGYKLVKLDTSNK